MELFLSNTAPSMPELFVGQRVWARWLAKGSRGGLRVQGKWSQARVLGEGEAPMANGAHTFQLYFDADQKRHSKTPLRHRASDLISTTPRS